MMKCTEKDARIKAKTLRAVLLVGWTVVGVVLLILIQAVADSHVLQKTTSVFIWAYVLFSAAVAGVAARLTKIMKKRSDEIQ